MELYLIRHGQADNNMPGWERTPAYKDARLTPLGNRQATMTGAYLAGQQLDVLYCSPLLRCLQTATHIAEATGLQPHVWAHMYELAPQEYYGWTMQELATAYPQMRVPRCTDDTGWWECCADSSDEILAARARHTVTELLRLHGSSDERVAVVAHGGYNGRLLSTILGLSLNNPLRFRQGNACINRLVLTHDSVRVITINNEAHLPEEERS